MAYAILSTNVAKSLITEEFSQDFCTAMSTTLNKPRGYCAVSIQAGN